SRAALLHDTPAPLPQPRGPLTTSLLAALRRDPHRSLDLRHLAWEGEAAHACCDEDLQLALWLAYELHYRGLEGVDERWEWHPELLWARGRWEEQLVAGLELGVARPEEDVDVAGVVSELTALAEADGGLRVDLEEGEPIAADIVVLATGRASTAEALDPAAAGIELNEKG
ncbi:FAD/NAD(P)-binding protein, partial [Acinetobacter baumannii]|nr:FAD/NAD(P)-binding protein [Acinetobacter baumannii]